MQRRLLVPLFLALVSATLRCAPTPPLSLCIVQSKSDRATQYEPSAGPWPIEIYKQLSGKRLPDGSPLAITVLPASIQKDILPEAQRLQCAWVLQLSDLGLEQQPSSEPGAPAQARPFDGRGGRVRGSLFFSLWNRETHKAIAQGAPLYGPTWHSLKPLPPVANPAASVAQQVLSSLNKVH